jgi:hypothetical protein
VFAVLREGEAEETVEHYANNEIIGAARNYGGLSTLRQKVS